MATSSISLTRPALADHLVALPGSEWALWRTICLRGAGFPVEGVRQLAASDTLINSTDALVKLREKVDACRQEAVNEVNFALDALRAQNQWHDKSCTGPLLRARDKLKSGRVPQILPQFSEMSALVSLQETLNNAFAAQPIFQKDFAEYSTRLSQSLRQVAASPRFREAVMWQNRATVHTALDRLTRESVDSPRSCDQRQKEELVASYLQRYSVKNDTIGFFGPVGWGEFSQADPLVLKPGPDLLAKRTVYFETWSIEELARILTKIPAIRASLAPILMPFILVKGLIMQHALYGPVRLSADHAAILEMCDGITPARQIADRLLHGRPELFRNVSQVYAILAELSSKCILFWELDIVPGAYPEQQLRQKLQRVADLPAREQALALLQQLESARDGVSAAAGDAGKLDAALNHLEHTYVRLTGKPPTRRPGQTYAARTIAYEDCQRNLQLQLGPQFLQELVPSLSLLLTSARWVSWQVVQAYNRKLLELHRELARICRKTRVPAIDLWLRAMPYMEGTDLADIAVPVQQEFQNKWARILGVESFIGPMTFSSHELRPRVLAEFAAPWAGWPDGRYHSPDIMIAADSTQAIRRGDYLIVLGEMHVARNTFSSSLFVHQHPFPDDLIRAVELDLGANRLVPMLPRKNADSVSRTASALVPPGDLRLEYTQDGFASDRSRAVPLSSLSLENCDGELVAIGRNGKLFRVIELVGWRCAELVRDAFKMFLSSAYNPRISIDRMVIRRETWRFTPAHLTFAIEKDAIERFVRFRAWAQSHQLPRFLFYESPVERKPAYLDSNSPILLDIFSRVVRRTMEQNSADAAIQITEMLPTPDQTWLPDAHGNRYCCELRMVALDLATWH